MEALIDEGRSDSIYRGHGDLSWQLVPSAYRAGGKGIVNKADLARWVQISSRFANPRPHRDLEWLVLAQHYGIPTALLDWSTSPLIALFFACAESQQTDGIVLSVSRSAFVEWRSLETVEVFREERSKPGLFSAVAMNPRTLAQDSVMSLHTKSTESQIPEMLVRKVFQVPASQKGATLEALGSLGYTRERLYSDISAAVEQFKKTL